MMMADELTQLRAENASLRGHLAALQDQLAAALARIDELENRPKDPPPFVKPNAPTRDPKPKRKRKADHNRARRLELPSRIHHHALDRCPDCNQHLHGGTLARRRQVIDIPEPQPVEVTEHQVFKRWCSWCQRWQAPSLDLADQVLPKRRFGHRLCSLITTLRSSLRLPIKQIQDYLATFHRLHLSVGGITDLLRGVHEHGAPTLRSVQDELRASPIVHADETGWREDGQNGYIWSFSTVGAQALRFYVYDRSRGGQVVRRVLGAAFAGHLVTDFYAAYNQMPGPHQRCWVHLLRDLHGLKEKHGQDVKVRQWAMQVQATYRLAQKRLEQQPALSGAQKEALRGRLVERIVELGQKYAKARGHPCQALAKRLLRHQDELFEFVVVEGLSADNNLAERSIRPLVVGRKISGGSRSAEGSEVRMGLASLVGTWAARGLNPFEECVRMLQSQNPLLLL